MAMDVADNAKEAEIFCIQWNQHQSTIITGLKSLLQRDRFIDVQLECEGNFINAHRLVLSSCSPYFEALLSQPVYKKNKKQTIIFLNNVPFADAAALVDFMYKGVVKISKEQMPSFMHTAEMLQIKGLTLSDIEGGNKLVTAAPPSMTESSKEIVAAPVNSQLSEAPISVKSPDSTGPSTSAKNDNLSSLAVLCEALVDEESERNRKEAAEELNKEAVDLQVDAPDPPVEKKTEGNLVLDINSNIQDANYSIYNEMEQNGTTTDLGSASQNETVLLLASKTSDPGPTENTADNSVIAGTSNSSSTYSYTRSTRKCKSSIGSYAIKDSVVPIFRSSDEFKPYMCEKCGRSYLYKGRLDYHKRFGCGNIPPSKTVDTNDFFPCPQCTYRSAWKGNLKQHIRSQHGH